MRSQLSKCLLWGGVCSTCLAIILCVFYAWVRLSPWNRAAAMRNGVKDIDVAQDFNRLFPGAEQFISYYQGNLGMGYAEPTWTSHVGLYGRYTFKAKFDIELDWTRRFPRRMGASKFYLQEISNITRQPDGDIDTISYTNSRSFGDHEWKLLKEANGDFSAIGYSMNRDQPLKGFDEAWSK